MKFWIVTTGQGILPPGVKIGQVEADTSEDAMKGILNSRMVGTKAPLIWDYIPVETTEIGMIIPTKNSLKALKLTIRKRFARPLNLLRIDIAEMIDLVAWGKMTEGTLIGHLETELSEGA